MKIYRVVATATAGSGRWCWSKYHSSWHETLADALLAMQERQGEGYDTIDLWPKEEAMP